MRAISEIRKVLRRFAGATEAVAAVEFALLLPFMLTLYMGSIELSSLITADRRVTTVAGTVGDLVSRSNASITQATLTDYFQAAAGIITPFSPTNLKQVVTCVFVSSTGVTSVQWSRGYNGGVARTTGQAYALPAAMINIALNSYVIVAEASYSYRPMLGYVFPTAIPLYRQNFYVPRYGGTIAIT